MGFLDNLFGSSDLGYPTLQTGDVPPACGTGPYQLSATGLINQLFGAKQLPYPIPACDTAPPASSTPTDPGTTSVAPTVLPAPMASTPTAVSPSAPLAVSPVTVVISPWPAPSPAAMATPATAAAPASGAPMPSTATPPMALVPATVPASTPTTPTTAVLPAVAAAPPAAEAAILPAQPREKVVTAVSYNPRFRESKSRAHEALLEEMLEENVTARMVARDSAPTAFVVPEGCDSIEFSYGAIEINDEVGTKDDLDQVVTIGEAQLSTDDGDTDGLGSLSPGTALLVTIPWRAGSWVNLGANHLKVTVVARFFARFNPLSANNS